jgi:MFS family permease
MNKKLFPIYLISAITYFLQGIGGLPAQSLFVYFKTILHYTPEQIMYFSSMVSIAWLIKPILSVGVDFLQWKKKNWIIFSILINILFTGILSLSGFSVNMLLAFMIIMSSADALRDISVDGVMVIEGKDSGTTGKIQAIQWLSITVAGIFVGVIGGEIAQRMTYQVAYGILLIPLVISLIVASRLKENPSSEKVKFSDFKQLFTNKTFLLSCLFLFLYKYSPSFGTPLAFVQRDAFGWSERFIGWLGAGMGCLEVLGAILYFKYSKFLNIKKCFFWSILISGLTTLLYLCYTSYTAIAYGILFSAMGMWFHLMFMDWCARNSIKNLETTSFAMLCSISNFAAFCSNISGAYLFPKIGLQPLIILSALTSFLCLPLINKIKFED